MMGRSFQSVRMGVNDIAGRWEHAARAMRSGDAVYADNVVAMAKKYTSEAFFAFDDPLEAAFFSVLLCMCREQVTGGGGAVTGSAALLPEIPSGNPAGRPRKPGNRLV
jgi:hypothetical protein